MSRPELHARPEWRFTRNVHFPVAALVEDQWWVLRLNSFPDHALWTLFIDGVVRFDIDDTPPSWGRPLDRSAPLLEPETAQAVLAPVRDFVAYGSEVGEPCDDPFCCG
ncbi:hypothetical protein [Nocardia sp. CS682]|uniref:hypothetical protein n=1 Tax=Nocardia sp. CS682 TaxID=1047172 RepID=UPI001074F694|nr:hypothetical protein [Nocardia sp. CS682]QBS40091.1 hypothetical protein DMB37_08075 [Nocardia sp. CS682]